MADPAADIWAMGIILYMVLFNKYPFEGDGETLTKNIIGAKWRLPEDSFDPGTKVISDLASALL